MYILCGYDFVVDTAEGCYMYISLLCQKGISEANHCNDTIFCSRQLNAVHTLRRVCSFVWYLLVNFTFARQ